MKNLNHLLVAILFLAAASSCKKAEECDQLESIRISGPAIAYLDSSFTLSVPSYDFVGYEWASSALTHSVGAVTDLVINHVGPEHSATYNLLLTTEDCGSRTISHTVEVRPKPFTASPCSNANNKMKLNSLGTVTLTSIDESFSAAVGYYMVEAVGSGGSCIITLGTLTKPVYDQVWNVSTSADYHTAEVQFRFNTGLTCAYWPTNSDGRLYVKKVTGGTEYSMCGINVGADGGCSGVHTTAEIKFVVPD